MGHACSSIVIVTVTVHLGLMLSDRGFSLPLVGWVVAVYTAVGAVFTMVGGYVGDRMSPQAALFGFSALQSAAIIVLLLAHSTPIALLFAVLLGIGVGGRTPLTTAIRGAYFGRRAFASITGVSMVPMNVLLLLAPWFAGYMFDTTGSYTSAWLAFAGIILAGIPFVLLAQPPKLIKSALALPVQAEPAKAVPATSPRSSSLH
jgi:MFS family permease